ncbi:protoheme IX farnesyltransferase 2 [Silvimonas iriomotensis]|uniref:Protoheme IX farnesyltransferase n=1 Tax=Silvimonas iriomotensis TaxID=449662 RepID=A0ABQ2PA85_9NEIS|nr:protoheme IX farnesyltransferase 2 [Silvimonas iriomotensis]
MGSLKLKRYLLVTKPGIIMGNLISTVGGFLLASQGHPDWLVMIATVIGSALVVASGCAINNWIDRDIDARMERTKKRVTVTGVMSPAAALAHGILLGVLGFACLAWFTPMVTVYCVAFGFFIYVGVYSLYMKRNSVHGTLVGSLSGAMPPVAGFCAAAGEWNTGALILMLMFCLWQMPHSYAIAIFRQEDYKRAGIPVLPVVRGITAARRQMVAYIIAFAVACVALQVAGYAGYGYMAVAVATSLYWLKLALDGRQTDNHVKWARQVFVFSIITVTALSVSMAVDGKQPKQQLASVTQAITHHA